MEDVEVVQQDGNDYFKISKPFQWILVDGKNESKARFRVGSLHLVGNGILMKETDNEEEYDSFKPFHSPEQKRKIDEDKINLKLDEIDKKLKVSLWIAESSYSQLKEEDAMPSFTSDIVVLIKKILKEGIWHGVEGYKDNRTGFAYHYVNPDESMKSELNRLLLSCNKVKKLFNCGAFMNLGNSGFTLTMDNLMAWLLVRSEKDGVESTVKKLINYLKCDFNEVKKITLVSGIKIDERIELSATLDLVPVSELGFSYVKEMIAPDFLSPHTIHMLENNPMRERLIPLEPHNIYDRYYPMVAAVEKAKIEPQVTTSLNEDYNYNMAEMAVDLLTLKNACAPFSLASWSELDEKIPCKDTAGNSWCGYAHDIFPGDICIFTAQDWNELKPLYENLLEMTSKDQDRIRLVLRRIANYKKRKLLEDKAIELGVAMEIVFLEDDESLELRRTLALRMARFMASDISKKKEIRKSIKAIYDLRSSAVHNGHIDQRKKIKISDHEMTVLEILNTGCDLLVASIKKIIGLRKIPLWSEFDLT